MAAGRDDGFTLLEALVGLVIISATFVALHQGLSIGWRGISAADRERVALDIARRELAEVGVTTPLEAGTRTGREPGGLSWQIVITPHIGGEGRSLSPSRPGDQPTPFRIDVSISWRDWYGPRVLGLTTIKLGGVDLAR